MEFTDVVNARKSIRGYSSKPVKEEIINKCLDAARKAPSWANWQCWQFIVVRNKNTISEMTGLIDSWIKTAPVVVVACGNPWASGIKDNQQYYLVDVAIALEHFILAAVNEGLGTCWIGGFDEHRVKKALGIPRRIRVVALTPVGYPADMPGFVAITKEVIHGGKKKLKDIVRREKW